MTIVMRPGPSFRPKELPSGSVIQLPTPPGTVPVDFDYGHVIDTRRGAFDSAVIRFQAYDGSLGEKFIPGAWTDGTRVMTYRERTTA